MTIEDVLKYSEITPIETRLILQQVCSITHSQILSNPKRNLSDKEKESVLELISQCKKGIPVAYLIGQRDFYKSCFSVNRDVLIPQPDTEILVEQAVISAMKIQKKAISILDLCCGTGCIGISVAKELSTKFDQVNLLMTDISPECLACAEENAEKLLNEDNIKWHILQSDLFSSIGKEKFDLICSNPPYIETNIIPTLSLQVQNEPHLALDGGIDGLEIIRKIMEEITVHLNDNGFVFIEIGHNQGQQVKKLFEKKCLNNVEVLKDFGNNDRVVRGQQCTKN